MRRFLFAFVLGGLLGGIGGFAVGIFLYPFIFLADIVAEEDLADTAQRTPVGGGSFVHADPSDRLHYGRGKVTVYADLVRLEPDFEVGPGPKYHVYLVPLAEVTPETPVEASMFVDLGRLRAFKGSQNYPVPAGVDVRNYASVVIWCEQFDVLISPARLAFGDASTGRPAPPAETTR